MKVLWKFIWGHLKKRTVLVGHFYAYYGLFLRSIYRMGKFGGLLKYQIFWGTCIVVLFFFWGVGVNSRCLVRAYVARNIESTPMGVVPPLEKGLC